MVSLADRLQRGSVTHRNRNPLLVANILRATPRFPDEDSTRIESDVNVPSRSAASTISLAAFSLMEPAKLNPSHFRYSECPKTGSRSTYNSSSLKLYGSEIIGTVPSPSAAVICRSSVPAELVKKIVDIVQIARTAHLVVDVFADCEVEHAEA